MGEIFYTCIWYNMSYIAINLSLGFMTRSNTNWAVQPKKRAIGMEFLLQEVERLYYQCSKNKGVNQLHMQLSHG